jgi:hypothetical protein
MRVPSRRLIRPPDRALTPLQAALLVGGSGALGPVAHLAFHGSTPSTPGLSLAWVSLRGWPSGPGCFSVNS